MAQPILGYSPGSVISSHFCYPSTTNLTIARKVYNLTNEHYVVNDVNDNLMFRVIRPILSLGKNYLITNAAGRPIATIRQKYQIFGYNKWEVFRGESMANNDLIFSVKPSSTAFGFRIKLNVFLANNATNVCDYKVKTSWACYETSCEVYAGDSSTEVARMYTKLTAGSVLIGNHKFVVTVHPNIDHAFIVALIVILNEIISLRLKKEERK